MRELIERLVTAGQWKDGDQEILIVVDAGYDVPRPVRTASCDVRSPPASPVSGAGHPVMASNSSSVTRPPGTPPTRRR
jgi:hypothetical protein